MNPRRSSSRRRFLGCATLLPVAFRWPSWAAENSGALDAPLMAKVIALVTSRESLTDTSTPFRRGAAEKISVVMSQYATVAAELAKAPPSRLLALNWALRQYVTPSRRAIYAKSVRCPHVDNSVTSFGEANLKCNKLVADAYAAGAGCGLSTGSGWYDEGAGTGWPAMRDSDSLWPPQANDLANSTKNIRSLTNARNLRSGDDKAQPELGDIIAFPSDDGSGHTGLYLGKNLIVSAKETGIEVHPLEYEQSQHGNIARIRKFTGSGK
jgi:cell wall-associated NlpC family hydrolase